VSRGAAALAALLALLALASPCLAATPQTSVNDVEAEVMCPICGTLLELAESPQAQRERVLVKHLIAEGKSKAEVKDALVAQYGPAVRRSPLWSPCWRWPSVCCAGGVRRNRPDREARRPAGRRAKMRNGLTPTWPVTTSDLAQAWTTRPAAGPGRLGGADPRSDQTRVTSATAIAASSSPTRPGGGPSITSSS